MLLKTPLVRFQKRREPHPLRVPLIHYKKHVTRSNIEDGVVCAIIDVAIYICLRSPRALYNMSA